MSLPARRFLVLPLHHIAQLVFGVWIQKIESIILQRGMDARLLREVVAKFGQSGVTDFLRGMKSGYFALKLTLQRLLGVGRQLPLRKVKTQSVIAETRSIMASSSLMRKLRKDLALRDVQQPFVRLTGCSRVVLLVSQALSV